MEGEKRNADRQRDVRRMNRSDARQMQCGIEQADNEIGIFEKSEQADVNEHRDGDGEFAAGGAFAAVHPQAEAVVHQRGGQQQKNEINLAPRIKRQAHQQEPEISESLCPAATHKP